MGETVARVTQCLVVCAALLWAADSAAGSPTTVDVEAAVKANREKLRRHIGPQWTYAKRGDEVTLHFVFDAASRLNAESTRQDLRFDVADVRWFKVAPTAASLDNTTPSFHFEEIPYADVELTNCRGKRHCVADVSNPYLPAPEGFEGTGTMAFRVEVTLKNGKVLKSAGLEQRVSGGIGPLVHRVTVRADDSYPGYLTELFGTPYIFGSAGNGAKNQTDLLIGSDCADLAVYGKRRMGQKLEYTSSYGIDQLAPEVVKASAHNELGVLTHADGKAVKVGAGEGEVKPGDVVHFPGSRHVAVFYEDKAPLGVLDMGDHILHTCWAAPTVEPMRNTNCSSLPVRILRFK